MMKFIIEDDKDSVLSKFFKAGTETAAVIFAGANTRLYECAKEITDDAVVFLDMNPWNSQLWRLYNSLYEKAKNFRSRLILLPIVCAEYNLLYGIKDRNDLVINNDMYRLILHKEQGKLFNKFGCNTYEKFCKKVLNTGMVEELSTLPDKSHLYYIDEAFDTWNLEYRRYRFYMGYRVVPADLSPLGAKEVTFKDVFEIHLSMVDSYNEWVSAVGSEYFIKPQKYTEVFRDNH